MTLQSFRPTVNMAIDFDTTLRLTSLQPGLVYGMYFYGCNPATCATNHDEIDIELVTNVLQPGPLQVQLNRYANEPLGAGNGGLVNLPVGFDPLAVHTWSIRWSLNRIDYLVDGVLLGSATDHVAQGPMQVNEIAWGPASDWPAAYSSALQPVSSAGQNQTFTALLTNVTVQDTPEPPVWSLVLGGIAFIWRGGRCLDLRRS
jgi:beta-glucanase (GH16 family)